VILGIDHVGLRLADPSSAHAALTALACATLAAARPRRSA
jgi:hypothetical protein